MKKKIVTGLCSWILMVSPLHAKTSDDARKDIRQVTVSGHGKVSGVPDQARLWVEVSEQGTKLDVVSQTVRERISAVLKTLKSNGIADKDIQTQAYQVNPQIQWEQGRSRRVGYGVSNRIQITLHDLRKTGTVISAVLDAGANSINGPAYDFEKPEMLQRQALQLAMEDAKGQAQRLVETAGASLGDILIIQAGNVDMPMPPRPMVMRGIMAGAAMSSAPEPIAEGENTVSADVTATYLIH